MNSSSHWLLFLVALCLVEVACLVAASVVATIATIGIDNLVVVVVVVVVVNCCCLVCFVLFGRPPKD